MGLLLGNAHHRQGVQNSFAFDLQFPGKVVNTNLHPPSISSVDLFR
jgi:hypothetical protein